MPDPDDKPRRPLRIAPSTGDVVPARPRPKSPPREIDEGPSDEDIQRFGDVTRTCPECHKEVFDDAAICYHCGHAFERTTAGSTKASRWVVGTIVVIIIAFVLIYARGYW